MDRTETSISSFGRGDAELHQADLIEDSSQHAFHVLKILPFERKLAVAINILAQHGDRDNGRLVRFTPLFSLSFSTSRFFDI